jgi:hypothetical protein
MIGWRLLIWIGLGCATSAASALAQQLNVDQINLIKQTAADICNTVKEVRGVKTESEIQGDVQARLNGLLGKLVDLGVGAQGSTKTERFQGLTQDATAIAMQGDRECRERLFNKMFDKLGQSNQAPVQPAYDRRADIKVLGKYLDTPDEDVYISNDFIEITRIGFFVKSLSEVEHPGTKFRAKIFDIGEFRNGFDCTPAYSPFPRIYQLALKQRQVWAEEAKAQLRSAASLRKVPSWCGDDWILDLVGYPFGDPTPHTILLRCSAGACFERRDPDGHVVGRVDQVLIRDQASEAAAQAELEKALSGLINHAEAQ